MGGTGAQQPMGEALALTLTRAPGTTRKTIIATLHPGAASLLEANFDL